MPSTDTRVWEKSHAVLAFLAYDATPIGGVAVGLMLGTYALLGVGPSVPLLITGFCGALVVYQLDRGGGFAPEDRFTRPGRYAWMQAHMRWARSATLAAGAVLLAMLPQLRGATLAIGVVLGGIGLLHVVPLLRGKRIKRHGWAKPLTISGVWALGGVGLPAVQAGAPLTAGVWALVGYRFALVLANTVLADIEDRRGDAQAGLHTVATAVPPRALRAAVAGMLFAVLASGVGAVVMGWAPALLLVDLLGTAALLGIARRRPPLPAPLYGLLLDALIAWPLVTAAVAWLV